MNKARFKAFFLELLKVYFDLSWKTVGSGWMWLYQDQAQSVWARDWGVMTEEGWPFGTALQVAFSGLWQKVLRIALWGWAQEGEEHLSRWMEKSERLLHLDGFLGDGEIGKLEKGFGREWGKKLFRTAKKTLQQTTKKTTTKTYPKNQPQPPLHWHFNMGRHYCSLCTFSLYPFLALTFTSPPALWWILQYIPSIHCLL